MRVLAVSPLVPGRDGSGGQTREFHLLRRLAERGHDVSVCCPVPAAAEPQRADAEAAGVRVRGLTRPASRVAESLRAFRSHPARVSAAALRPLPAWQLEILWGGVEDAVADELDRKPDVVLVVWDAAAAWLAHLPTQARKVLSLHDASWAYLDARAAANTGLRRAVYRAEARRMRGFARTWLPRYDDVVCVSDQDAVRVRRLLPELAPAIVPNGVDLAAMPVLPDPPPDAPPTVLFTGTLDYPPNTDAAQWLARDVWPAVREQVPGARLLVAGRRPPESVRAACAATGAELHADVADLAPLYASAHVATAPLHFGGGTRLKILEAAARGRAVVSTTLGAEGLDFDPDRHLVLADDPSGFAGALVALLGDAGLRTRLARAARARVEERYDWPHLGDRLAEVLSR